MEIKQTIEEEIKILQNILNYTRQKKVTTNTFSRDIFLQRKKKLATYLR